MSRTFRGWGIELVDRDGTAFLPGVGYSPQLLGKTADFGHVVRTLVFETRGEARGALASYKAKSAWAFAGTRRIYRSARVVRLTITVSVGEGQ